MTNLTQQGISQEIDDERRESNAAFASPARILRWMNKCNRTIIKKPGVHTVPETTTIAFTGNGEYTLPEDFIAPISLYSGTTGSGNQLEFQYTTHDDMNMAMRGFGFTFKSPGKIYIFATSVESLPSATLTLDYWSTLIVITAGNVKASTWVNATDKSRLPAYHDDLFIDFVVSMILRREGKDEWKERLAMFTDGLDSLSIEGGIPKPPRKRRSWGH